MRSVEIVLASLVSLLLACEKQRLPAPAEPAEQAAPRTGADPAAAVETVAVAGNIHMLVGRGGNVGVSVGDDGVLIVDDQFEPSAPAIRAALEELSDGGLAYVLNTHHHGDHTGGNPVFGREATIVAHENVRERLSAGGLSGAALPVITFDGRVSLHFNGEEIRAVHLPGGHTDGDSVIFFTGSNVVHMGDLFFNGRFPFVDLSSGGDVGRYLENVETVLAALEPDAKIIPGHGPLATIEDLRRYHAMLEATVTHVVGEMDAGKTLAAIKKAGLPAEFASWDGGFISGERWIETIHTSRSRATP
jgi:cyclase